MMTHVLEQGGIVMYPLLVIALGVLWLAARTAWLLSRSDRSSAEAERPLQGLLFWGVFSVVLGFLGTVIGIIQIAQAIRLLGQVEPPLVWAGFGLSLVTLIFGLLIFLIAALLWFVLRQWSWHRFARNRSGLPAV
jgi:biopolymer transport protein ExbB/TolQ